MTYFAADKASLSERSFLGLILIFLLPWLPVQDASAVPGLVLRLESMMGSGWSAQGIAIELKLHALDASKLVVDIDKIYLAEKAQDIKKLRLECSALKIDAESMSCPEAVARLEHALIPPEPFWVTFSYHYEGHVTGSFRKLPLARGSLSGRFTWQKPHWFVSAQGAGFDLKDLITSLGDVIAGIDFELAGEFDVDFNGKGDLEGIHELEIVASIRSLTFSDSSSRYVSEDLGLQSTLNAKRLKQDWHFDAKLELTHGQIYLDPLFLEIEAGKQVEVLGSGLWSEQNNQLQLTAFNYLQPDVITLAGKGEWSTEEGVSLRAAYVDLLSGRFPRLYTTYLQPFLIGTVVDELQTIGSISGELEYRDNGWATLKLKPNGLHLKDSQGRFAIDRLEGDINWSNEAGSPPTRLSFGGGSLYRVELGPSEFDLKSTGRNLSLLRPTVVPVFDGKLRLASFGMENVAAKEMSWHIDAGLTPVSMEILTEAIGWPSMSGKLSGMIPDVRYEQGKLIVGGALLLRVFNGDIIVNNLRMRKPLGLVPVLSADVDIAELDLETLTRTFSFGKIQGKLEGHIKGLRLIDWQPVQFDARIGTPADDRSRHRISQRAIDDLTSIGGGMAGVLSSGFLRFFEEFSYERIGLSCRLSNSICQMDGISPAKQGGYYIVKGKGLPRIDVIGFSHRVDWFELLERLKNIQLQGAPVVR